MAEVDTTSDGKVALAEYLTCILGNGWEGPRMAQMGGDWMGQRLPCVAFQHTGEGVKIFAVNDGARRSPCPPPPFLLSPSLSHSNLNQP